MGTGTSTRRNMIIGSVAAGLTLSAEGLWAQTGELTRPVDTTGGRLRGTRSNGVSSFLGVPYGGNTQARRFQPALPASPWRGVRDCVEYGNSAPQSGPSAPSAAANPLALLFGAPGEQPPPESEDCLFLNVFTPDPSPARRRPVLFWLHGGGFTRGNGSALMYDGSSLCRRGDVVVVTINHRLNAMGYLFLGALHDDFADSGNAGQHDQILALKWVRRNIAAFGGDPGNITIFGQSGGGNKVSALMATPAARGLFHKAIIQSGPGLRMIDRDVAANHAERTLARLDLPTTDIHRLLTMDHRAITQAAMATTVEGIGPVVDGRLLKRHPFDPDAPGLSRDIPLIIGTTRDEATLSALADPQFGRMTEDAVRQRFAQILGDRADAALDLFRRRAPDDPPSYWYTSMTTARDIWMDSIRLADRKVAQNGAPVFMYRLDWESPAVGGRLRALHGLDTPLVFDNVDRSPGLAGSGPEPRAVAAAMSQACINFARTGNPSADGLDWPTYRQSSRQTMIFDLRSAAVSDPDQNLRRFFSG